jgi:5-methylcytosine-specific restriction protein A
MTLKICGQPGCPEFTASTYCPKHEVEHKPPAHLRGYGHKWTLYSAAFKKRHPLCRLCLAKGIQNPTEIVDHIEPVTGPDDPGFWDKGNHQPLCRSCHAIKTAGEGRTSQAPEAGQDSRRWVIA